MNETENRHERKDRRKRATPFFSRYMFWGRRKANRRTAEPQANYYVDRIGFKYWLVVFIIVFLSAVDAFFTLHHFKFGYQELNPILKLFKYSTPLFLVSKFSMTVFGIVSLVFHQYFHYVRQIVAVIIALYLALDAYQIYLFFHLSK
jgi:hypothetical protein